MTDPILGKRQVPIQVNLDEVTLKDVAELVGGRYFRVTNAKTEKSIDKSLFIPQIIREPCSLERETIVAFSTASALTK